MVAALDQPAPATYAEMTFLLSRVHAEAQALLNTFIREGKLKKDLVPTLSSTLDPTGQTEGAFTLADAKTLASETYAQLASKLGPRIRKNALPVLEVKLRALIASLGVYESAKAKQDNQVYAALAGAVVGLGVLPPKLNPVIRSVMSSIKFEDNKDLQSRSARAIAHLVQVCVRPEAKANPTPKVVKNLCAFVCQDLLETPLFTTETKEGILLLPEKRTADPVPVSDGVRIRRGAQVALRALAEQFGARVFTTVPALWDAISSSLMLVTNGGDVAALNRAVLEDKNGQGVLDGLTVLRTVLPSLSLQLEGTLSDLLTRLGLVLQSELAVLRAAAAETIACMARHLTPLTMRYVITSLVPLVDDAGSLSNRQGGTEALALTVRALELDILPYLVFLLVPLLGRMGDANDEIRLLATSTFGSLVQMVPLEQGLPDPPDFPPELLAQRAEQRKFLTQLLGDNTVEEYKLPVQLSIPLRPYQLKGVSWLAFLARYRLHGALCDDMGLGKTLQSIAILASSHFERHNSATAEGASAPVPSLVVCPPTLTGHWVHEVSRYAPMLKTLLLVGTPLERASLVQKVGEVDVVVTSYDVVRNDIEALAGRAWNYCILDEGHVIKNAKTKTTRAVKRLRAHHRLLLSGTPVQNSVLELWSLFDFLMPGFLGSEKQFHERYARPILATRDGKANKKERERADLALEALHRQVLPFILRRLKEEVLDDLPPKIIQDIQVDLSPAQEELYDDFSKDHSSDLAQLDHAATGAVATPASGSASEGGNREGEEGAQQNTFQTLQYLRKLVNHPSMVLDPTLPRHRAIQARLEKQAPLASYTHSPKLLALKQLLNDCGIGLASDGGEVGVDAVSQHRVLVFCQMKGMLDLVEQSLFKEMPSVSYLRLDGGTPSSRRYELVQRFNSDPSIDVLLLTTSVGGLGLTLTGADTVVFLEHDWNPMKDLQAMDRAHRLGQKKVVNVYRLISRNTLEARIMGLQRFKLAVANTVVSEGNKQGLEGMGDAQVLDLFAPPGGAAGAAGAAGAGAGGAEKDKQPRPRGVRLGPNPKIEEKPDTEEAEYAGMQSWAG